MATSRAHKDRPAVEESLKRHGFTDSEIEVFFVAEAEFARRDAASKGPAVEQTALDFGDWADTL